MNTKFKIVPDSESFRKIETFWLNWNYLKPPGFVFC